MTRKHRAAILSTTRVGLAAAEEVFSGSGAVVLEQSEKTRWVTEVYPVDHQSFWWYAFAWWTLKENVDGPDDKRIRQRYSIPPGSSYWVVDAGVQWGGLAGGVDEHVWRWDGERADFLGRGNAITF